MKRYQDYMDSVEVSDTLHEKLSHLEKRKTAQPWKKYGAMAAAVVLVAALGVWGVSRLPGGTAGNTEIAIEPAPSTDVLTPGEPADPNAPPPETVGGYEITDGEVVGYYLLPRINYADEGDYPSVSTDYSLAPLGALSREATRADLLALVGDENALADHLLWDSFEVSGVLWFLEDGTPCAGAISLTDGTVYLHVEMVAGGPVPSCVVFPEDCYESTTVWDVEISALKNTGYMIDDDGTELRESRELSFLALDTGCKLTIYGGDSQRVEDLCARFTRWGILEGFDLTALDTAGAEEWN